MVNSAEFVLRLQKIIGYYGETASSFSEKIKVQRSSISHILSGRNKPSLDFVLKILDTFPDVNLYWLLNGTGTFPTVQGLENNTHTSPSPNITLPKEKITDNSTEKKTIDQIVIFYSDGSFKHFNK